MNSIFSGTRLLAAALCGATLVACNAVEDVREAPTFAVPAATVVLGGTINGISATRPVVLEDRGALRCDDPASTTANPLPKLYCSASIKGTSALRLGSIAVGTPYNIVVKTQPFGRVCTVVNGSGVAPSVDIDNIVVNCARSAVTLRTITATISAAASATPGLKVRLTTEEGVETVNATGLTSVAFTNPVFDAGTNLPSFDYRVTAFTESAGASPEITIVNNCNVTNATGSNPTANVPNATNLAPTVTACTFAVSGAVSYSVPPTGGAAVAIGPGMTLGLKDLSGTVLETVAVVPGAAGSTITTALPTKKLGTTGALYELVVATQPTGQFCVVSNGGPVPLMVSNPADTTLSVLCRATPAPADTLVGTYQLTGVTTTTITGTAPALTTVVAASTSTGTTTTTTVGAAAPTVATTTVPNNRNFLTFFANGTFLYGTHNAGTTTTGVEHGFYTYDSTPGAQRIYFTIVTDTNTSPAGGVFTGLFGAGLSGTPGPIFSLATFLTYPTMVNVVKTPGTRGTITGTFGPASLTPGSFTPTNNTAAWTLTEPIAVAGQMQGAWATEDSKRVWVYSTNLSTTIPNMGFHVGVNGAANLQDKCILIDDDTLPSGVMRQQPPPDFFNAGSCLLGTFGPVDFPHATSTPAILTGYVGRMPGLQPVGSTISPVHFTITAGTPDTLTVQDTLNDVPVRPPVVFKRTKAN